MARIRLLDQKPQYTIAAGPLAAGGTVHFFISGTSTPKDVFSAPSGGTNLGSVIDLEADGRHEDDVWLEDDAAYRVDVRDSDGASIPGYPLDDVGASAAGGFPQLDPADGNDGDVRRTDGTTEYWGPVRELADGTGHTDEVWHSDGTEAGGYYAPLPTAATLPDLPDEGVTEGTAGSDVTIGTTRIVCGSDTAPTNGTIRVSKSVTFASAFGSTPKIVVSPTVGGVTGDTPAAGVSHGITAKSESGFTVEFFAGAEANGGNTNITGAVTFDYIAMGVGA